VINRPADAIARRARISRSMAGPRAISRALSPIVHKGGAPVPLHPYPRINISAPHARACGYRISATPATRRQWNISSAPNENTIANCLVVNGNTIDCKNAIQTNNVELDDRGMIYIADRAGAGMHILRLSGEAKEVVREDDREHEGNHD